MTTPTERLPAAVRVAGYDFAIELYDKHAAAAAQRYGECSSIEQKLRFDRHFATPFKAVDTVMHELLHALYWAWNLEDTDKEERIVSTLGTALMTLHRDNPWLAPWITETLANAR